MDKYEYKVMDINIQDEDNPRVVSEKCNELGLEGWKLLVSFRTAIYNYFVFGRKIQVGNYSDHK